MTDPIVQDVRDARASIAAEFGYDLSKYLAWIREQTRLRKDTALAAQRDQIPGSTGVVAPTTPLPRKRPVRVSS